MGDGVKIGMVKMAKIRLVINDRMEGLSFISFSGMILHKTEFGAGRGVERKASKQVEALTIDQVEVEARKTCPHLFLRGL
jgi:hypothetical protein